MFKPLPYRKKPKALQNAHLLHCTAWFDKLTMTYNGACPEPVEGRLASKRF
jgi:hypothetical protein